MDKTVSKKEQGNPVKKKTGVNGNSQPSVPVKVIEVPVDQKLVLMQPEAVPPPKSPEEERRAFWQVHGLMLYFIVLIFLAFWFFLDVWSGNLHFMNWMGVQVENLDEQNRNLLRAIGFTLVGGFLGSVLYQIRLLYQYYLKSNAYDYRWMGKYVSAPWESAIMSMVVLALIRGGVTLFGGSQGTEVNDTNNFAAFGVGALVGFGMRDVVGWIGGLVRTMFKSQDPEKSPSVDKEA
jgi:hypothetical protein